MRAVVWAVLAVVVSLGSVPAEARDLSIKAFFGLWKGNAVSESEISVHFRVTARDLDVEVQPFRENGFTLRWATVQRQEGNPNAPSEVLKEAVVNFDPDPTRPGVWLGTGGSDPRAGEPIYWARIEEQTLVTYIFGIQQGGEAEVQVYRRTLTGNGMDLDFTRTVDGEAIRRARGRLIKFSN